jgi:TP53 regulating kinase-like protein
MKEIAQGAEAVIKTDKKIVVKHRTVKRYRHSEIDDKIRKSRTRKEAKVIKKVNELIPSPKIIDMDDKEMTIHMEYIDGQKIRDVLEGSDYKKLCRQIGKQIAAMHNNHIIHGDLTTSNMILKEDKIHFIDFGLSFDSHKIEDKAVDLWLIKQAFDSKHYKIASTCFDSVLVGYKEESKEFSLVLDRLKQVEMRGRNKHK